MVLATCTLLLAGGEVRADESATMQTFAPVKNGSVVGLWHGDIPMTSETEPAVWDFSRDVLCDENLVLCLHLETNTETPASAGTLSVEYTNGAGGLALSRTSLRAGSNWLMLPLKRATPTGGNALTLGQSMLSGFKLSLVGGGVPDVVVRTAALVTNKYVAGNPPGIAPARDALLSGRIEADFNVAGRHPRVIINADELNAARKTFGETPGAFRGLLPKPGGDEENYFRKDVAQLQNPTVAAAMLAKLSTAYALTDDSRYLDALEAALPYLRQYQPVIIQRLYDDGDDLVAGDVLLYLSIAYDLSDGRAPGEVTAAIRSALVRQTGQTYVDMLNLDRYAYMQNHFFTPAAGVAVAASALAGEVPEADAWSLWGRNVLRRVRASLPEDAWCFESVSYWTFQNYLFVASHALKAAYGEELVSPEEYAHEAAYLAHIFLPDPEFAFDFGDTGPRVQGDGVSAQEGYDWPWHTYPTRVLKSPVFMVNREVDNPVSNEMVRRLVGANPVNRRMDSIFGMLFNQPALLKSLAADKTPIEQTAYHYFSDMDVAHWRGDWTDPLTTAIAIKCGPPAGHRIGSFLEEYPHTSRNFSHAHPDAGSFILFSRGSFLANDTAYLGKKETAAHNSIMVDGIGQKRGGTPWFTFEEPYDAYKDIRMENVWLAPRVAAATCIFDSAYDAGLRLTEMKRKIILIDGKFLVIADSMGSDVPHTYEWLWHSDTAATEAGDNAFEIVNRSARVSLRTLSPVAKATVAPTIVETELYTDQRTRPQQRGYHISLQSASGVANTFLNAARIGKSSDDPDAFQARELSPGKLELTDGRHTCIVWLQGSAELEGDFAYLLYEDAGKPLSCGVSGSSLNAAELSIQTRATGSVTFAGAADGSLAVETFEPQINRESVATTTR